MNRYDVEKLKGGFAFPWSPLALAVEADSCIDVERLLDQGADINDLGGVSAGLLTKATSIQMFHYLVQRGLDLVPNVLIEIINNGESLHKEWKISEVIQLGVDPDGETGRGRAYDRITPLVMAIRRVFADGKQSIKTLLDCGADANKWCFNERQHPLHHLVWSGFLAIRGIQDLERKGQQRLIHAQVIDDFLAYGANMECRDSRGLTPLLAAAHGSIEMAIEDLHDRGANLLAYDNFGADVYNVIERGMLSRKQKFRTYLFVKHLFETHYGVDPETGEITRNVGPVSQ